MSLAGLFFRVPQLQWHKMCSFLLFAMIRSRNIQPLLSRITGDGINAALLVTADGALLGSSSEADQPPAPASSAAAATATGTAAAAAPSDEGAGANPNAPADQQHRLDYAAIGALVAEVAADYQRLGIELNHLDPRAAQQLAQQQAQAAQLAAGAASPTPNNPASVEVTSPSSAAGGTSATGTGTGGTASAASKAKAPTGIKCMIVEMDGGTIGVSSAGASDCYVVAMADADVEHGLLRARLTALSDHCAEAFMTMS